MADEQQSSNRKDDAGERVNPAALGSDSDTTSVPTDEDGTQAPTIAPDTDAAGDIVTPPPLRIGTYRLLGMLGEGAMGVVYRAEQDSPRREVALKVLKAGTASAVALDRFEQETQVLGRLQHPGIAQIFQAGTADTGYGMQPFFAMEFVHGEPLKEYADSRALSTRQRLKLLIAVCQGVQHAHQKGVIHRDLKPGNILVDETGQPKILDFGIALLSRDDDSSSAPAGESVQIAGTIPYMSPEQLSGDAAEIDTRSDVYALGVICYQLLSGKLPFGVRRKNVQEAVQIVTTQTPVPLGSLVSECRGDVETIVAKALATDKSSRYSSASELAADIQRFFDHEPVQSHPQSGGYLLHKFVRRNRTLVASAFLVFVSLLGALWWTNRARAAAEEARARAQDEADIQKSVTELALSVVDGIAPELGDKETPASRMRGVLDQAIAELAEKDYGKRPAVEAALRAALGKIYRTFGDFDSSLSQLRAALTYSKKAHGAQAQQTLELMQEVALSLHADGQFENAEALYRQAIALQRTALGPENQITLETMQNLALLCQQQGNLEEAGALFDDAMRAIVSANNDDDELLQGLMNNQAFLMEQRGESDAAQKVYEKALATYRKDVPEHHPQVLIIKSNLADLFISKGDYAKAEALFEQIIDAGTRVLGEDHITTLDAMNSLARALDKQGRTTEAHKLYERTYDAQRRHLGDDHPKTIVTMHNYASLLARMGELDLAEEMLQQVTEYMQATFGPNHPEVLSTMNSVAGLLKRQRKLGKSADLYKRVLAGYERTDTRDKTKLELARYNLACVLHDQANVEHSAIIYAEAETAYRQTIAYFREKLGDAHQTTVTMKFSLAKLLSEKGDFTKATALHDEVLQVRKRLWPGRVQDIARSQFELGDLYLRAGRFAESEALLRDCIIIRLDEFDADDYRVANAENALGAVLTAKGAYAEAEAILSRTLPVIEARYKPSGRRTQTARQRLVSLYNAWQKPDQAAKYAGQISDSE